jgi:FAD synthetase
MVKVMVFGSFDEIHPGHIYFLKNAKKYGTELIVILGRDKTITELKGKPKYSEKERKNHLLSTKIADKILLGNLKNKYKVIEKINPDIICLGYDQIHFLDNLKNQLKKMKIDPKIIRLNPYKEHIFKSSKLKKIL